MGDVRQSRGSPPSRLGGLSQLTSFTPSTPSSRSMMNMDSFAPTSNGRSQLNGFSPDAERRTQARIPPPSLSNSTSDPDYAFRNTRSSPAILLRRLPRSLGSDALRSMLLFAQDLVDVEFVDSGKPDDKGFLSAVARFESPAGALEAKQRLNGKPNATRDAEMIVEIVPENTDGQLGSRRNTIDGMGGTLRHQSDSSASTSSNNPLTRQSSRFTGSFQTGNNKPSSDNKISPPLASPNGLPTGFPNPESDRQYSELFSPTSPLANTLSDGHRVSGKALMMDDGADDETGHMLNDLNAFTRNSAYPGTRRPTVPSHPISQFGGLSLSTNMTNGHGNHLTSPSVSAVTSPRSISGLQSPGVASPNGGQHLGGNGTFSANYRAHPPANPADQNPPINTLYVGNLPTSTSEDELKSLFSKQKGYKRLCFRTKSTGPMAFVEFEDVSYATKALHELYGVCLSNSTKGGIRLSFSKNPLGVRSGQMNGMSPSSPMNPQALASGFGGGLGAPPGFTTANGPPPGLAPPGMRSPTTYNPSPLQEGLGRVYSNNFSPNFGTSSRPQQSSVSYASMPSNGDYANSAMQGNFGTQGTKGMYSQPSSNGNYFNPSTNGMFNPYQELGMASRR